MKHSTFSRLIIGALWLNVASFGACVVLLWAFESAPWIGTLVALSAFTLLGVTGCALAVWATRRQQRQQMVDTF